MRKWWKNYRYRFTPYVRGDLTKMKNARYADEGPLTSQAELCRQLNEVRRGRHHYYHHQIFTPFFCSVFELLSSFKWRFIKLYAAFWISPRDQVITKT